MKDNSKKKGSAKSKSKQLKQDNIGSYATKLTDYEVNKMKELKSNTVRFTSGGGIGVGVECLVEDKWIDITDYNCW